MPRAVDYYAARSRLDSVICRGRGRFCIGQISTVPVDIARATEQLMRSATQAYREVLVGCCLARILESQIDIHLPYASQGENAYNGRYADETVVNPFLQSHEVPASRGPFLSVFRRSVKFAPEIRAGVRDKDGFDALLGFSMLEPRGYRSTARLSALSAGSPSSPARGLRHRARACAEPEPGTVRDILRAIAAVPSGGRFPVLLTVAMFQTIRKAFNSEWEIDWQGINVADRASEAAGDITIRSGNGVVWLWK